MASAPHVLLKSVDFPRDALAELTTIRPDVFLRSFQK